MDKQTVSVIGGVTTAVIIAIVAVSCLEPYKHVSAAESPSTTTWEYKVLYEPVTTEDIKSSQGIQINESDLNLLGKDRWSLSAAYVEEETVFPNLGDPKYITGVQPNIRPRRAVFIFQRSVTK